MTATRLNSRLCDESRRPEAEKPNSPGSSAGHLKILHVINDLSIGGSEMMLYKLLSEMNREVVEPAVVSLIEGGKLRERIEALNVRVFTAGMSAPVTSPAAFWRLIRLAVQFNPDVIQGWMYHGSLAAQFVKMWTPGKTRVLWGVRNSISVVRQDKTITDALIRLGALISWMPDGIIYVSHANRSQHEALGYYNKNSYVIPNGFNTILYAPSPEERAKVRAELGIDPNTILIGLIGRFHPAKDHFNFLRAAALLLRDYSDVKFVLCGKGVDCHNRHLNSLAGELGIAERLHLLGERQDIPRLLTAFDIISSSSRNEAFPNVIGEAMSCGVNCVATDVGDVSLLVGETGMIVPPCDSEALAGAWKRLIELGRQGRTLLGETARKRIIDRFSLESVVVQYEALYHAVAGRKNASRSEAAAAMHARARGTLINK